MTKETVSQDNQTSTGQAVRYHIKPYTGIGSGVLKHGTLIKVGGNGQYEGPESIVGSIEAPGTWQIEEVQE